MFKRIQLLVISAGLLSGLIGSTLPIAVSASTASTAACDGVQLLDSSAKCQSADAADSQKAFSGILQTVINVFSIVIGAVSVIMIIIGGFRYVISGGDSSSTKAAKDTIMYAVIGLVVVIFAQTIVRFVIVKTTAKPAATPPKKMITTRHEFTSLPLLP